MPLLLTRMISLCILPIPQRFQEIFVGKNGDAVPGENGISSKRGGKVKGPVDTTGGQSLKSLVVISFVIYHAKCRQMT